MHSKILQAQSSTHKREFGALWEAPGYASWLLLTDDYLNGKIFLQKQFGTGQCDLFEPACRTFDLFLEIRNRFVHCFISVLRGRGRSATRLRGI